MARAPTVKIQPESLRGLHADWYYADYARAVLAAGGLPVNLPLDADATLYADHLDGIVFSGGADIWSKRYGEEPHPEAQNPQAIRDEFELTLMTITVERQIPLLGICRGLQLINVFAGGTLHQHVPEHNRVEVAPDTLVHDIDITPGSLLEELYGSSHKINSLHHQTIKRLGEGLVVTE